MPGILFPSCRGPVPLSVMPGQGDEASLRADVPGIHVLTRLAQRTWMAGRGRDRPGHDAPTISVCKPRPARVLASP